MIVCCLFCAFICACSQRCTCQSQKEQKQCPEDHSQYSRSATSKRPTNSTKTAKKQIPAYIHGTVRLGSLLFRNVSHVSYLSCCLGSARDVMSQRTRGLHLHDRYLGADDTTMQKQDIITEHCGV